jgi:TetR/AcrR family transcriptional repressor of uid operon
MKRKPSDTRVPILQSVPRDEDPAGITRRERRRLETRERLFEAAIDEFRREGVAGAQIERIVQKAGVARGTFYFHFPTKEHVLFEMQRRLEAEIVQGVRRLDRADSVEEFLRQVVETILAQRATETDPELVREIMAMYVRSRPASTEPTGFPILLTVADYLSEAADRGEIRVDVAPEELATLFLMSMFGFLIAAATDPGGERGPQLDLAIDIFVGGIQP